MAGHFHCQCPWFKLLFDSICCHDFEKPDVYMENQYQVGHVSDTPDWTRNPSNLKRQIKDQTMMYNFNKNIDI
jgi:hypothetical protein